MKASMFRQVFDFSKVSKETNQWFPGHMAKGIGNFSSFDQLLKFLTYLFKKGLKQIYEKLPEVDAVIQVHDARIPFTGRNKLFRQTIVGNKPYIFILNKSDLADLSNKQAIIQRLKDEGYFPCYFTNLKDTSDKTTRIILPNLIEQINNQLRFNRDLNTSFNLLVIGVPNVGKSTLINKLRNFHLGQASAVSVGANPGITKAVHNKVKVNRNPLVYMYDTPGVLETRFKELETGFKLACLNCIKNHRANSEILADYLLYRLNKAENFKYVEYYQLKNPTDNIFEMLLHVAKQKKRIKLIKGFDSSVKRVYDVESVANKMLKQFFDGELGKIMLDDLVEPSDDDKNLNLEKFV